MGRDDQPRWHPMLATQEPEPGVWVLVDSLHRPYGLVQIVKVDDLTRFRAEHLGRLLGYATSLRTAAERVHHAELQSGVPGVAQYRRGPDEEQAARDARARWVEEITAKYRRG